ncbi:Mor transcription activator family protein [Klebsiella grimontii]|uniref:Mor transcription activator family protein n=1 Tax=Klebsiella grimontii TaxID=2058152 RepID=UPI000D7D5BF6|nr:Mor transcription activator family protein [Klebsiella grimontii]AWT21306.1 transcriptional regulator [Klebsiella michiganensis]QLU03744.1 transcriptional regulator [Klebsiella oxytoca]MDV1011682.1 Mor transcription activator family protein [Klebsiella grimontii]MDV1022170.1 Mor transcription activator family protein [Klebsiella grimontii]MDV1038742.1 Mor transcription activator family protein [Klebsiella grimontii]
MSDDLFGDVQDDSILEHMDDSDLENVKFPVLIAELNDLLRYEFQRIGIAPYHSIEVVSAICSQLGGIQIYLPRGKVLEYFIRDIKIWRDYTGDNVKELAHKYEVTFNTIYKAIRRMRRIEHLKRQPKLL